MKIVLKPSLVTLALMSVSACMSDKYDIARVTGELTEMTFEIGVPTKAQFTDDYKAIFWSPGDCISVFSSDAYGNVRNGKFQEQGLTGAASRASFKGEAFSGSPLYTALYPFSNSATCTVSGKVTATVAPIQSAVKGGFDPAASVAVGYLSESEGSFYMMNVCGWLGFEIHESLQNVKSLSIVPADPSVCLSGEFTLTPDSGYASFGISSSSGLGSLKMVSEDGYISPGKYYLASLPAVLEGGFTINVEFMDGRIGTMTYGQTIRIVRNQRIQVASIQQSSLSFATLTEEVSAKPFSSPVFGWSGTAFNQLKPFNVLYGSGCCDKYGEHLYLFDGNPGTYWLTYLTKSSSGAIYGDPFVVIDLGAEYLVSEFGVAIQSNHSEKNRPCDVEFYITRDVPSISLTAGELSLMFAGDNLEGNSGYAELDARLRAYDSSLGWVKAASFNAFDTAYGDDYYKAGDRFVPVEQSLLDAHQTCRYVKVVLKKPQPGSEYERVRNALGEFYLRHYTWYDGYEFKVENLSSNPGAGAPGEPVAGAGISGGYYDWTVTGQPERPYMLSYHDKLMMKFLLATKDGSGGTYVRMNFEDVLENIKVIDELTRGMEKIVYLVGWQYEGHDSKYPAMAEFNTALKRDCDASAKESYLWLQAEARKYNTYISAHINLNDAYEDSPLYMYYLNNDMLLRWNDGTLVTSKSGGHKVLMTKEWNAGWLQKRIDDVIELLNLKDSPSVHLDVFLPVASPFHGISADQELETLRKVARYWREKGVDITVETWHNLGQRLDPMFGLIPAVWWNDMSKDELASIPPSLATGSRIFPGWDYYDTYPGPKEIQDMVFLFGENVHGEDIVGKSTDFDVFKYRFCISALPYVYFSAHSVLDYDKVQNIVTYSGGLVADAGNRLVTENGRLLRDGNDMLFPAIWRSDRKELIAYSESGYNSREWTLPDDWAGVSMVKLYVVGSTSMPTLLTVKDNRITLKLNPNQMLSIQPVGL